MAAHFAGDSVFDGQTTLEPYAMTVISRIVFYALLLVLAGCTDEELTNGALGTAKNWCQNSPQMCSVHEEKPPGY